MTLRPFIRSLLIYFGSLRDLRSAFDPYARYLAHQRVHHPEQPPLDRRAFYLQHQSRKWNGISRCC